MLERDVVQLALRRGAGAITFRSSELLGMTKVLAEVLEHLIPATELGRTCCFAIVSLHEMLSQGVACGELRGLEIGRQRLEALAEMLRPGTDPAATASSSRLYMESLIAILEEKANLDGVYGLAIWAASLDIRQAIDN